MSTSLSLAVTLLFLAITFVHAVPAPTSSSSTGTATISPYVGASAPKEAVDVSPFLISLSLEGDAWPQWAANAPNYNQRNDFFHKALQNLRDRTGSWPDIRVGANSEDRINFDKKIKIISETFVPPTSTLPYPEAANVTVGPSYYTLSKFMPSGTTMTWGFNFGSENLTLATIELNAILDAFKRSTQEGGVKGSGVELKLVELGNEADLYNNNGHRNKTFNEADYVAEWRQYIGSLLKNTPLGDKGAPKIQALAFGHSDFGSGKTFSPEDAFADGLLDGDIGEHIGVISQHTYSGGCCTALIADLMNKTSIRHNISVFENDIAAVKAKGLPYYFGETNTYFNHGVPKVSDAGGAALWLADYALFGATVGIEKMYFHEGVGYKYNLIQPVALDRSVDDATPISPPVPAHVQSPYYGALAVTEFLGTSSTRKVVEITFDEFYLSGYALYGKGDKLSKVILFNHEPYLSDGSNPSGVRPSYLISLQDIGAVSLRGGLFGKGKVSIKRLEIPHADVQTGLTWAGQSFDQAVAKGKTVVEKQSVKQPVVVQATEVVLVEF